MITLLDGDILIENMKQRMKEHPVTRKTMKEVMAEYGVDEDTALEAMIYAWLKRKGDFE